MAGSKDPLDALRSVLREIAAGDAPELIREARRGARLRASRLIEDALVEELLHAAAERTQPRPAMPGVGSSSAPPRDASGSTASAGEQQSDDAGHAHPNEQAWWAYCVLSAEDVASLPRELGGIEPGHPVEAVVERGLAALVSAVPAAEYDDETLRNHLEDLEWVERTARAHEAVLEQTLRKATIVPLRLCTIYRDVDGPHRLLLENAEALSEGLARVAGCTEWGVKVFVDTEAFEAATAGQDAEVVPDEPEASSSEKSGAAYLARRRQERAAADRAGELRAECVEAVHDRVSGLAREAKSNPVQRPEMHGRTLTMLLNGAYLVEHGRTEELKQTIDELRTRWQPSGFIIELTGPWPAYNFVSEGAGVVP